MQRADELERFKSQINLAEYAQAQGYEINKFKITSGQCYEIYGKNQAGKKVEIYFDPVSGKIVKQETR